MPRQEAYPLADPFLGPEIMDVAQMGPDGRRHTRAAPVEYLVALAIARIASSGLISGGGGGGGGGDGGSNDFVFTQSIPQSVWTIPHNQGRFPHVVTVDSAGDEVEGDVRYVDANEIILTFSAPFAGAAYCH